MKGGSERTFSGLVAICKFLELTNSIRIHVPCCWQTCKASIFQFNELVFYLWLISSSFDIFRVETKIGVLVETFVEFGLVLDMNLRSYAGAVDGSVGCLVRLNRLVGSVDGLRVFAR